MIIVLVIISAFSFYFFNAVKPKLPGHLLYAGISLVVLIASITAFVMHDTNHLGMKEEVTTKTYHLASLNDKMNILTYKQLGTSGKEKVFVYKTSVNQKKPLKTRVAVDTKITLHKNATANKVKVTSTHYVYKDKLSEVMFGILNDNKQLKNKQYDFYVDNSWLVVDTDTAAKLPSLLKSHQADMQATIQANMKASMQQAQKDKANMSQEQQINLQKQLLEEAKVKAIKQLLK